jgi:hypothetical protein
MTACTVSMLMPNSSTIDCKVTRRSCATICRTLEFCLSTVDQNMAHPQLFPSRHESIWTSRKHIFCWHLPSRTLAPTFHASLSPFSLVCSRTWCSAVAPLHCDPTSHSDYVRLPTAALPWRSRVLYATWHFSTYLWIATCIRAYLAHVAIDISDHSPNFLDTPCISAGFCYIHFHKTNSAITDLLTKKIILTPSNLKFPKRIYHKTKADIFSHQLLPSLYLLTPRQRSFYLIMKEPMGLGTWNLGWNISYTYLHIIYEIQSVSQWWWATSKRYHTNLTYVGCPKTYVTNFSWLFTTPN